MIKVLKSMIILNPVNRCTCSQALQMAYFNNDPVPTPPHLLPQPQPKAEIELPHGIKRPNMSGYDKSAHVKKLNFDD